LLQDEQDSRLGAIPLQVSKVNSMSSIFMFYKTSCLPLMFYKTSCLLFSCFTRLHVICFYNLQDFMFFCFCFTKLHVFYFYVLRDFDFYVLQNFISSVFYVLRDFNVYCFYALQGFNVKVICFYVL